MKSKRDLTLYVLVDNDPGAVDWPLVHAMRRHKRIVFFLVAAVAYFFAA